MAVIGIDSHKDTLAGCLIDDAGTPIEHRELPNTAAGHAELVAWASAAGAERVGIEGSGCCLIGCSPRSVGTWTARWTSIRWRSTSRRCPRARCGSQRAAIPVCALTAAPKSPSILAGACWSTWPSSIRFDSPARDRRGSAAPAGLGQPAGRAGHRADTAHGGGRQRQAPGRSARAQRGHLPAQAVADRAVALQRAAQPSTS